MLTHLSLKAYNLRHKLKLRDLLMNNSSHQNSASAPSSAADAYIWFPYDENLSKLSI